MAERTEDRLVRLLGLVTYLSRAGEATVADLAERFAVTEDQIRADVSTLWVTGLPGYWPNDLLDFDADAFDAQVVRLLAGQGLERPLRLGTQEAIALVAALRALSSAAQGVADDDMQSVLAETLTILTAATGEAAAALDVDLDLGGDPAVLAAVDSARSSGRRLRIEYTDANDVTRERVVEPWSVDAGDGRTYVQAWDLGPGAVRTFRVDRIVSATVLDETATHPPVPVTARDRSAATDSDAALFASAPDRVRLTLRSPARTVAETVPSESVTEHDDGSFTLTLRVQNHGWLEHLVLSNADDVVAVEPAEVARAVGDRAARALEAYEALGLA